MEKAVHELAIDEGIKKLRVPLQEYEMILLEDSILKEGCDTPLVVWKEQGVLLDGHERYRICRKYNIPFAVIEKSFPDRDAAELWVAMRELGHRHITDAEFKRLMRDHKEYVERTYGEWSSRMIAEHQQEEERQREAAQQAAKKRQEEEEQASKALGYFLELALDWLTKKDASGDRLRSVVKNVADKITGALN